MDCKECDGLLVAYAKGELAEDDAKLVERHIAGCESCRWNEQAARRTLELLTESDDESVIKMAKTIIQRALDERATDIHVEPMITPTTGTAEANGDEPDFGAASSRSVRVRYRIDGVLHEVMHLPGYVAPPLVTRLMVMSETDPFELRVPQFGRLHIRYRDRDYDIRLATLPTTAGMRIAMRLLSQGEASRDLADLGLSEVNLARIQEACVRPQGVFLVTGPAGAGRTTLLYAMLSRLSKPQISILTIEDPVEVRVSGISQIHVNRKAGMGYAEALKAILRNDPDIIMCAEVPDSEVARLLNEAALTGHLVLASLPANDAADGLSRFLDLGPDRLTGGKALIGGAGIRLVRKVCPECAEEVEPSAADLEFVRRGVKAPPGALKRAKGCKTCHKTGYLGRTGIHEVLLIDEELREQIQLGQAGLGELRAAMQPSLMEDAAAKAAQGITTIDEAIRVTTGVGRK